MSNQEQVKEERTLAQVFDQTNGNIMAMLVELRKFCIQGDRLIQSQAQEIERLRALIPKEGDRS